MHNWEFIILYTMGKSLNNILTTTEHIWFGFKIPTLD